MVRVAYVDHSYHRKTLSSRFLADILRQRGHTVDFFWDEAWQGGKMVPFSQVADYDAIIMFQCRCASPEPYFRKLHPNVTHVPMLDTFGIHFGPRQHLGRYWEFFQGCKILSFSSVLHGIATSFGLRSFFTRYYPPPGDGIPSAGGVPPASARAFFWIRHEKLVSWPMVRALLHDTHFDAVHLHIAPDPDSPKPTLPTEADRKKYTISTSTWFAEKRDFLSVLERSNIFFAPRREEGIGLSFLEAMARGQCVVAPDNATMNEYILHGVNGLLYDADHPGPLDFSRFAQMGFAARQSVAVGHDRWLATHDRLEEFILMPSAAGYRRGGAFPMEGTASPLSRLQRIRNWAFVRKTERLWMPVWRLVKTLHDFFAGTAR